MTQEKFEKAKELQRKISTYEVAIRYCVTNQIRLFGTIVENCDLSDDKELAKLIYNHCKQKQRELIKEYEEL